jgi:rare lipoprotein A
VRRIAAVIVPLFALMWTTGDGTVPPEQSKPLPVATERPESPVGLASYYWRGLDGRKTASGILFDVDAMVAAHPTYEFGTRVRVTNLANQRSIDVEIVDRGPVRAIQAKGVIIDLSPAAARALDFIEEGRTRVRLDVITSSRSSGPR